MNRLEARRPLYPKNTREVAYVQAIGQVADVSLGYGPAGAVARRVVNSGGVAPGRTFEIGAGSGTNALWLAERGFDVIGVDVSPLAVERAKNGEPRSELSTRHD